MKKNNKKGFTLAELLIVVAIIAVLTAIAIPVFTTQLEKSREATDLSNVRSAYAGLVTDYLTNDQSTVSAVVAAQQRQADWQTNGSSTIDIATSIGNYATTVQVPAKLDNYTVTIASTTSGASITVK